MSQPQTVSPAFDLGSFSKSLGWSVAGVCDARIPEKTQSDYEHWLQNLKGPGMQYLEKRKLERKNPQAYFKEAKSILCFGLYYFQGWAQGKVKISNYAWGKDYHQRLKDLLEVTAQKLKVELGDFEYRISVDTAPLLEKPLATQAGLGWQAKNTLLLNTEYGSALFLGELLTSLPINYFQATLPVRDHCGTCTRCIDACPTQALTPYKLDATKCISYWTLEHKGAFTPETPQFHGWIAGCDICQEVCPWNQKLIPLPLNQTEAQFQHFDPQRIDSLNWSEQLNDQALSYIPSDNWKRNLDHLKNDTEGSTYSVE